MNFRQIKSWQWVLIVLALLVALDWAIRRPDPRTRELNAILETQASARLKNYPYTFHVVRVEGSTAVMSTPRNFDSPAFRFLGVIYPDINVKDHNNPAFIEVEKLLGKVQDEAKDIVLAQPDIKAIRWELDRDWLRRRGIEVLDK
jgi:DNA topoisomerase VI subunit A